MQRSVIGGRPCNHPGPFINVLVGGLCPCRGGKEHSSERDGRRSPEFHWYSSWCPGRWRRPEHSRSTLGKGIGNDLNKATLFCSAPTRVSSVPGFSLSDYQALSRRPYHRFGPLVRGCRFRESAEVGSADGFSSRQLVVTPDVWPFRRIYNLEQCTRFS